MPVLLPFSSPRQALARPAFTFTLFAVTALAACGGGGSSSPPPSSGSGSSSGSSVTYHIGSSVAQAAPIKLGTTGGNAGDSQTNGNKITCCGGTLGALVQRDGTFFILSANHVLAKSNAAKVGDAITQPGLDQNNCSAGATVANLSQFADLQTSNVDAAMATIVPGQVDTSGSILALGAAGSSSIAAAPPSATLATLATVMASNEGVAKVGSNTGQTCSTVTSIATSVKVDYSQTCGGSTSFTTIFNNQVIIQGGSFSATGDSGSLVVTTDTGRPVGLLFAGNTTSSSANPIQDVLAALQDPGTHSVPTIVGGGDHAVSCVSNVAAAETTAQAQAATSTAQARVSSAVSSADMERAESIRQRHAAELLANPAVSSVFASASADDPSQPAIEVHLSRPSQQVPKQIEGVRTRVVRDFVEAAGQEESNRFSQRMRAIMPAKERHANPLLSTTGIYAVGVGRSQDDTNDAAIVIVGEPSALASIPAVIDGVRTRLVTGDRYSTTWGKHEKQINACATRSSKQN